MVDDIDVEMVVDVSDVDVSDVAEVEVDVDVNAAACFSSRIVMKTMLK